jgi:hypothetical protein
MIQCTASDCPVGPEDELIRDRSQKWAVLHVVCGRASKAPQAGATVRGEPGGLVPSRTDSTSRRGHGSSTTVVGANPTTVGVEASFFLFDRSDLGWMRPRHVVITPTPIARGQERSKRPGIAFLVISGSWPRCWDSCKGPGKAGSDASRRSKWTATSFFPGSCRAAGF